MLGSGSVFPAQALLVFCLKRVCAFIRAMGGEAWDEGHQPL